MSNGEARVVTLKEYADGSPVTEANFHIETRTLPDLAEGDLLLETLELSPDRADIYYDNVGGEISQALMWQMKYPARIVECGQISTYYDKGGGWMTDIRPVHINCLQWTGVTRMTFIDYFPGALAQLGYWLQSGRIISGDPLPYAGSSTTRAGGAAGVLGFVTRSRASRSIRLETPVR